MLRPDRVAALGLVALALFGELPVLRSLVTPDLNWCYPYMLGDSYDWLANGLRWGGADVAASLRPPGLPLLIALLWRLDALRFLPWLNFAALGLTAALLHRLLRHRHGPFVAALATWIFFAGSYVQELAKYVMAEVWATPFLVAAALAFLAAETEKRAYLAVGALLGLGYLVHYAAAIAGAGLAAAMVLRRRTDLARWEPWIGLALAVAPGAGWLVFRALQYRAHPDMRTHVIEALVSFSLVNVRFYLVVGAALLGLALVPLYAAGLFRVLGRREGGAYWLSTMAPLLSLTLFFVFLYRHVDKRFLVYALPFAVCLFAEGVEALLEWGRRGTVPRLVAAATLGTAVLWNQIRYPATGLGAEYLAITPRDFADLAFHIEGAVVTRVHRRVTDAFAFGLFDWRLAPSPCPIDERAPLLRLKAAIDVRLPPGEPVGFYSAPGWPSDYWSAVNRLGNVLLRPVVRPDQARHAVALGPVPGSRELTAEPPYRFLVRE